MLINQLDMVRVMTLLAERGVDVAAVRERMGCDLEVAPRPHEWCADTDFRQCKIIGVTWWPASGKFGSYNVCLYHNRVVGPLGRSAEIMPAPKATQATQTTEDGRSVLAISIDDNLVGWALVREDLLTDEGSVPLGDDSDLMLGEIATWLNSILQHYLPNMIAVDDPAAAPSEEREGSKWHGALGIKVSSSSVSHRIMDYDGLRRLERITGLLQGVASVRRPRRV